MWGDFRDLKAFVDWAADDCNVDFIGVNPLHAIFNRRPFNSSPYAPSSRIYRNFIYLDLPGIEDFAEAPPSTSPGSISHKPGSDPENCREEAPGAVRRGRGNQDARPARSLSEFHGKARQRTSERAMGPNSGHTWMRRVTIWSGTQPSAHSRSTSSSNCLRRARGREWPVQFRDPGTPEVADFRREHEEAVLFWMYVQWQIEKQLCAVQEYALRRGMRIGLYCDEALGVDSDGADFWAWQEYFQSGFSVGAPP